MRELRISVSLETRLLKNFTVIKVIKLKKY